jgi:hypothetical protein
VDLQLSYLAAPQSAAQASNAQNAPAAGQQAALSAFASKLEQREETVSETQHAEGTHIRTNPDGEGGGPGYYPQGRRQQPHGRQPAQDVSAYGLSDDDGEHFIDVIA